MLKQADAALIMTAWTATCPCSVHQALTFPSDAGATDDRITIDGILSSMMLSNAEGNGHGAESPCLYNRSINHAGPSGSSCHGCPSLISNADWPQQGSQYGFPREETDMRILKEYLLGEEEVRAENV